MHTLQVRELQKKVQSTSRLCRSEKQCWANAGLNPRQCIVLLAVYVLSGFSVLLAVEFLKSKSKRQDMEQHEQERFVEELYLRAEMAVLLKVEDPVTAKDVGIRREAVRFIANYKANGFVQEVNCVHGVAPTSLRTAREYLDHCEKLGVPLLNRRLRDHVADPNGPEATSSSRRNLRKWSRRFRKRWCLRYGALRPLDDLPVDEIHAKAQWNCVYCFVLLPEVSLLVPGFLRR